MATLIDTLNFLAPGLAAVPQGEKEMALEIAAAFRPSCLEVADQDLAQVYYAIWLLYDRKRQTDGGSSGIVEVPAGVKSIKEGDVTVTWGDGAGGEIYDPSGYYGRWAELNAVCGRGMIMASSWRRHGCC